MLKKFKEKFKLNGETYFRVKAIPGQPKTEVKEVMADETVKISLAAKAEKGKANQELIKFLAREFAVAKENVKIISGAGERLKLVKIVK